jgi:hypothetical protein
MLCRRPVFPIALAALLLAAPLPVRAQLQPFPVQTVPVYRVVSPQTGEHRFTNDQGEMFGFVLSGQFRKEGIVFRLLPAEGPDLAPLYRLGLPNGTTVLAIMTIPGFTDPRGPIVGTLGLLSIRQQPGWVSLYEWWNPNNGLWFYTIDPRGEGAAAAGYRYQRIVGYVLPPS